MRVQRKDKTAFFPLHRHRRHCHCHCRLLLLACPQQDRTKRQIKSTMELIVNDSDDRKNANDEQVALIAETVQVWRVAEGWTYWDDRLRRGGARKEPVKTAGATKTKHNNSKERHKQEVSLNKHLDILHHQQRRLPRWLICDTDAKIFFSLCLCTPDLCRVISAATRWRSQQEIFQQLLGSILSGETVWRLHCFSQRC